MTELFVKASRLKLRFQTSKGMISVEDLWDLPLTKKEERKTSKTLVNLEDGSLPDNLNDLAKVLNKEVKSLEEEDFVNKVQSAANDKLTTAFEIVKYIINVKLAEETEKKLASERIAKRQQLAQLIEQKRNEALGQKSLAELEAEYASL